MQGTTLVVPLQVPIGLLGARCSCVLNWVAGLVLQAVDPYTERRIVLGGLSEHLSTIRRGRRIMFVGCGTSYHAAMACRQVLPEETHIPLKFVGYVIEA